MKLFTKFLITLGLISSIVQALPVQHEHFKKREIVTRMHTADAQTVTDYYSTTTNVVVAPTVQFIVSGTATYTTTLVPDGVEAQNQPAVTLTTTIPVKQIEVVSSDIGAMAISSPVPTNSANADINSITQTTDMATPQTATQQVTTQQVTTQQSTTLQTPTQQATTEQTSAAQSTVKTITTLSPTSSVVEQDTTSTSLTSEASTSSFVVAIGNSEVQASVISQPPLQVYTSVATTSDISTTDNNQAAYTASSTSSTTISSTSSVSQATSSSTSSSSSGSVPVALTYSPYNDDGTCRSSDSVYNDLAIIKSKGVSQVRIYGTDCNSLQTVQPACSKLGIKINQGLWISSAGVDSIDDSITELIQYGQENGWDIFEYITIGNEAIISGYCTVTDLIAKIASVKSQLKSAGYTGQVTTSEPPVTYSNNPELCTESAIDFVGINPHSYFNSAIDASEAGSFVKGQLKLTQQVCGTSNVVITETGYPSEGNTNGNNVPSPENQKIAVQSILDELDCQVTILSYFNDLWKNPGTYGIENSFGIESFMP